MLTPGTITVNFTAEYAGPHRICWRQCGVGQYVCTNIINCVGGGNVCSAVISVMVNPESCDPVCFEGYIQATCNPEGSSTGQVPWTTTFTPNPACKFYTISFGPPTTLCTSPPQLGPIVSAINMGLNCNGTARPALQLYCGTSIAICSAGFIPTLPPEYEMAIVDGGCCYNCTQYSATITPVAPSGLLDGSSMYYIDCNTRELKRIDFTGDVSVVVPPFCAVTGSVSLQLSAEATGVVNTIGTCP